MLPEIWTRNNGKGLRIVYPNGEVYYSYINPKGEWSFSCCTRPTKSGAIGAIKEYDRKNGYDVPTFVCKYDGSVLEILKAKLTNAIPTGMGEDCCPNTWILPKLTMTRAKKRETNVRE